jgi:hypothetical protein
VVVVVAGALANKVGNGGEAWVRPTWTIGLERLGFDTWLVERLAPGADAAAATAWFEAVCDDLGVRRRILVDHADGVLAGPPDGAAEVLGAARAVFDLSGHLGADRMLAPGATWVHVDLDPGFTQFWAHQGCLDLSGYDRHVSVGTALADPPVPLGGIEWIPTLPPVLVDRWRPAALPDTEPTLRTVGAWRPPHGPIEHDGRTYGVKAHQFRRFLDLPARVAARLELALAIHPADEADRARLAGAGFALVDPAAVAGTPTAFRSFVQGSWGEWSVAQGVYVECRTGWVSDRSAHWLAAGRPVVVQDTGATVRADGGWSTFSDLPGAAAAIDGLLADPAGGAQAARAFAERELDAAVVLGGLCERIGVGP